MQAFFPKMFDQKMGSTHKSGLRLKKNDLKNIRDIPKTSTIRKVLENCLMICNERSMNTKNNKIISKIVQIISKKKIPIKLRVKDFEKLEKFERKT